MSYTLSGLISYWNGSPVGGATVSVMQGANIFATQTGADGRYSMTLPEGSYQHLQVQDGTLHCGVVIDEDILLNQNRTRNKTVSYRVSLFGCITTEPKAGATVELHRSEDQGFVAVAVSDASGRFSFDKKLCSGRSYYLRIKKTNGLQGDLYGSPGAIPCDACRYPALGDLQVS